MTVVHLVELHMQPREVTESPEETASEKPVEKRPRASTKEEEWVVVPLRENLRKEMTKKVDRMSGAH